MNDKYVDEYCPHCESEVRLKVEFKKQKCPECGVMIKPCALCDTDKVDCADCPLGED